MTDSDDDGDDDHNGDDDDGWCLHSALCVPDAVLSSSHVLGHLVFKIALWGEYC